MICRTILDETILVPISGRLADMQNIYVLDTVSAFIWDRLDGRSTLERVHALVLEEFQVEASQARDDLFEFMDELIRAELVVAGE